MNKLLKKKDIKSPIAQRLQSKLQKPLIAHLQKIGQIPKARITK